MKKVLLCAFAAILSVTNSIAQEVDELGYTTVELTTSSGYSDRVFFDLSENNIESQSANNWDVAFYRVSAMDFGTRINDAQNIAVYEASNNVSNWDAISIADEASWGEPLYNPDLTENLQEGAFEQGSATYGWGEYNMGTHHIEGSVIFVLKYLDDESYVKFMIEDYFGGYTFKYAKWNGTSWDATQTKTVANGTTNTYFNYFSFETNAEVPNNEPEIGAWDLMFTRYWTFYGGIMMYRMAGVIQSPDVSVALKEETQATNTFTLPSDAEYSNVITTIGHSWKPTSGVHDNVVYYIKQGEDIYRLYFIENGGQTTGNMYFKYKKVVGDMSLVDLNSVKVSAYPNPVVDQLNITSKESIQEVKLFNTNGQLVLNTKANSNSTSVNVASLKVGVYVAQVTTAKGTQTIRVIKK